MSLDEVLNDCRWEREKVYGRWVLKEISSPLQVTHIGRDEVRQTSLDGGERSASANKGDFAEFRVGSPHQKLPINLHSNFQDPFSFQSCPNFSIKLCGVVIWWGWGSGGVTHILYNSSI